MSKNPIACSFCGKGRESVHRLIGGPNVYICDQCVDQAEEILEKEFEQPPVDASAGHERSVFNVSADCALCHLPGPIDELLAIPDRGFLCAICLDAIRVAADEAEQRRNSP